MTPFRLSSERSEIHRGIAVLLATIAMALVVGSLGCRDADVEVASRGGDTKLQPGTYPPPFSSDELQIVGVHVSPTVSAEFTADGKWIIVSGSDGVTVHDAASTECVNWLNATLAEVSPDGRSMLLDYRSGAPELRSVPEGRLIWRLPESGARHPMHFSDDGQYIVCGYHMLLRVDAKAVSYRAPDTYYFDPIYGGDRYHDPADAPRQHDADQEAKSLDVLPYIYRVTLRHDGRSLITPKSGICSPAGRFLILQTGEQDSSLAPFYSFIHRRSGERLFSDVSSADALFFHNDDYVLFGGSVYRTKDKAVCYALAPGITSFALNRSETGLAIGWRNGEVAVVDPVSGKQQFRTTVEEYRDTPRQESGAVMSLAFTEDSKQLAAVGRKLTLVDIPSQTVADVLHLGPGGREIGTPERTAPARVTFNADGSRLLLTSRQSDEYIYSREKALVVWSEDLKRRRHLSSQDYFDRVSNTSPVYFSANGAWAIVPHDGRGARASQLQLWDTVTREPIADIAPQAFRWNYRRRFVVPDFPRRHLGLGRFRNWYADEIVFDPWSIESLEAASGKRLPPEARQWLENFVQTNPHSTSRYVNGITLDFPARQWKLRFDNNRIQRLYDLSTGTAYPADITELSAEQAAELDAIEVPASCWGLASVYGIAFSPDGARLLVSCRWRRSSREQLLALFEMPSGQLIRDYAGFEYIEQIHIAPNNQTAAISTAFYNKTWIIDLASGGTLVELPKGGMCVFSPDSRYAQVGDRYGESQSLLTIGTGDLIDLRWADRWAFSPNSQFVVGGRGRDWFFLNLETAEKTQIPGEVHATGIQTLSTTKMDLPCQETRLLCTDKEKTTLYNVNAAKPLATFDPTAIASRRARKQSSHSITYTPSFASRYLYSPNGQDFLCVLQGQGVERGSQRIMGNEKNEYSTQLLVGDLEAGQQIECSAPHWSRSPLQHSIWSPDGQQLITISADEAVCWKLHPPEVVWQTGLSDRWIDPETGLPFSRQETLNWSLDYAIHPSDQSILIAADGREAILFSLATGKEQRRFGPLPINSVLRFGADGTYLQVGYRANRSMRLYDVVSGELVRTYHFTNEGTKLHSF